MSKLFKPARPFPVPAGTEIVEKGGVRHARIREGKKEVFYPITKDGTKYLKPAAKWAADVRHADGRRRRMRFSPNYEAAAVMLAELLKRIENEKAGVIDRLAVHRKRPLTNHVDDWRASLAASGRGDDYVTLKVTRVRTAFDSCGFNITPDLSADRLETYLLDLRTRQRRSIQTSNDWLQAVRQFCRWMVANDRLERDPFSRLKPGNAGLDARRRRGEFSPDERVKILATASASRTAFRGLQGPQRAMLYRLALGTGFRAAELSALVPDYFDLSADTPAIVLPAEFTKNRKGALQPLGEELAAALRSYLKGLQGKEPIWPGKWVDRSADMLKGDMVTAGVPVQVEGTEGAETRDFHSLRNSYISDLMRTGADLKQAMTLARHSDPRLTAKRYARTRLHDLGSVVNKLPQSYPPSSSQALLRRTGTDTAAVSQVQQGAAWGAARSDRGREGSEKREESPTAEADRDGMKDPLENQGVDECRGHVKTIEAERAGFEPAVGFYPHAALAKRCFRPLSHLSGRLIR